MSSSSLNAVANDAKSEVNEEDNVKPKRRRRGKKRRHRNEKDVANCTEHETSTETVGDHNNRSFDANNGERLYPQGILIRPIHVPKAPKNSTQFIIDDHDECRLYFSFETPDPYQKENNNSEAKAEINEGVVVEDAAFQDIDYKYESLQDSDDTAFYAQDFEDSYNNQRYEELMQLPREELVSSLERLDLRLKDLEDALVKHDPSPVLEELQHELLQLQEENMVLKEYNTNLKKILKGETDESGTEQSHDETGSGNDTA